MRVEPVLKYREPDYPRIGEGAPLSPVYRLKNKALIAAMVAASGALSGCLEGGIFGVATSGIPMVNYFSEQEIIQILLDEAGKQGVTFSERQDIIAKYRDLDIILDLYNDEKQIGAAVIDRTQANEFQSGEIINGLYNGGIKVRGSLDSGQPVDFFLASEYIEDYSEGDLRKNFRDFLEWLHDNGII